MENSLWLWPPTIQDHLQKWKRKRKSFSSAASEIQVARVTRVLIKVMTGAHTIKGHCSWGILQCYGCSQLSHLIYFTCQCALYPFHIIAFSNYIMPSIRLEHSWQSNVFHTPTVTSHALWPTVTTAPIGFSTLAGTTFSFSFLFVCFCFFFVFLTRLEWLLQWISFSITAT